MDDLTTSRTPRLYSDLTDWWPLLSAPEDYAEEAAFYQQSVLGVSRRPIETLLELGSGGGNNASHLKSRFRMTLTDRSAGMLAISRRLNPECEHIEGDMRTLRLDRRFDAVFVHDAIAYMTSEEDVRHAIATASIHCEHGGAAVFAPDHLRETFRPSTDHGGHDEGTRGLRYVEWTWDPDPSDTTYTVDYGYLLRAIDGSVRAEWDRHLEGLFSREQWLTWLRAAGFDATAVPFNHSELEPDSYEIFVCRKR